ncbi:MAG: response regulator [Cyanothece sp. SIO1E1]|nr:response regulator [Cyanothece sp. SIO1E1]
MTQQILIIDDDDGIREVIQAWLEVSGEWEVLSAASGLEGIAIAKASQPDAILLDMVMPDLDGLATFERLQADPGTATIPTILLTAQADVSQQQQLLDLGCAGIIAKPFRGQDLTNQIKVILSG